MASSLIPRRSPGHLGLRLYAALSSNPVAAVEVQAAATQTKKLDKTPSVPSAYNLFRKDDAVKNQLKDLKIGDASKKASTIWNSLSADQRKKFEDQSAVARAEHEKLYGKKRTKAASSKPKTGYAKFVSASYQDTKAKLPASSKSTDVFKEVAKKWKSLSAAEKAKF